MPISRRDYDMLTDSIQRTFVVEYEFAQEDEAGAPDSASTRARNELSIIRNLLNRVRTAVDEDMALSGMEVVARRRRRRSSADETDPAETSSPDSDEPSQSRQREHHDMGRSSGEARGDRSSDTPRRRRRPSQETTEEDLSATEIVLRIVQESGYDGIPSADIMLLAASTYDFHLARNTANGTLNRLKKQGKVVLEEDRWVSADHFHD